MSKQLSNSAKWAFMALATLLVVALLLALAEGAVRVRQWVKYGSFSQMGDIYQVDKEQGLRVPVADKQSGNIKINSLGFRGPQIEVPKPVGRLRLAFLGASTTFCAEVSDNETTWPHLVAQKLREAFPRREVDYVNGGVPGYVVSSSVANLKKRVAPLQPDVIVIYHATNDLSAETRRLAAQQGIYNRPQAKESESWLAQYSLLWFLVEKNLRVKLAQQAAAGDGERLEFDPASLGQQFRQDLSTLITEAQKVADVVAVATFSHQVRASQSAERQLQASSSALYYMPFMSPEGLLEAYERYNQIIREVARETGAVLIGGEMEIPGDGEHFNDTVHFSDSGSRLMAERVVGVLREAPSFRGLLDNGGGGTAH